MALWFAYRLWDRFDCIDLSAAFAYHTLQSIFPIFLIALSVASRILGSDDGLTDQVTAWITQFFPSSATTLILTTLTQLYNQRGGAGLLGVFALLITASNAYLTLQRGADRLWGWRVSTPVADRSAPVHPWRSVRQFVLLRLKAFSLVAVAGVLLVLDQFIGNLRLISSQTWRGVTTDWLPRPLQIILSASAFADIVVSLLTAALVALILLRLLPSRPVPLRPLLPGAILIGLAHTVLNAAVGRSLVSLGSRFQAYGVISGVLVLTLWIWLLGLIFYYGLALSVVLSGRLKGGDPHLPAVDPDPLQASR